jgi:hypothetical protein
MLPAVECLTTGRVVSRNIRHQNLYGLTLTPRERWTLNVLRRIEARQFTEVGSSGGGVGFCPPPAQSACGNIDRFWDYLNPDGALASLGRLA